MRGGWSYNRDFTPAVLRDHPQRLRARPVSGPGSAVRGGRGLRRQRRQNERANLSFIGGGDYERENFTNLSRNSAEANFGNDFLYKLNGSTSVTQSMRFFPNLTNTGEYRLNFDLGGVTVLKKWLAWT